MIEDPWETPNQILNRRTVEILSGRDSTTPAPAMYKQEKASPVDNVHKRAWHILKKSLADGKTSWGKNELARLMSECLEQAMEEV